jgi:hypothetical protein
MYRRILYCGINHQFVKPEKMGISKHVKEEGKGGKISNNFAIMKKKLKRKENDKQTKDYLNHVGWFDPQAFQIYSVTHNYLDACHTRNECDSYDCINETNIKMP